MLEFFRKNTKIVMWGVLFFVGVPFVGMGFFEMLDQGESKTYEVYGHTISATELMAEKQMINFFNQGNIRDPQVLENTARQNLTFYYKAVDAGVKASDQMVRVYISKFPPFLDEGTFEKDFYTDFLSRYRMTNTSFEDGIRRILTTGIFRDALRSSVRIGDEDVREDYKRNNETADFISVSISSSDYESKVEVSEDDILNYFNTNKSAFEKEEEIKIEYVVTWADDYIKTVSISDEASKTHYENVKEQRYSTEDKEGKKKTYTPFVDVQGDIKSQLAKNESQTLASEAMDEIRERGWPLNNESLERLVKERLAKEKKEEDEANKK